MYIDQSACDAFWSAYLAQLAPKHPHRAVKPDRFGFGGEPELADELAALTLAGRKCATTSMAVEFTSLGEALPRAGDLSIIVRGDGAPAALIERTQVETKPFGEVDERYAAIEGEGDGSLAYWRRGHIEYFTSVCERDGGAFTDSTPVICQMFRVVWPQGPRLVMPSAQWRDAFQEMARDHESAGELRYAMALRDFDGYLRKAVGEPQGEGLPQNWVPHAEYWLEDGGQIVACVRLRFRLNAFLEREGGHIGYDVRPSLRCRGYGTTLLAHVLVVARAHGLHRILVTCDDDNIASSKVIERNGGVLAGHAVSEESGKAIRRYWIE